MWCRTSRKGRGLVVLIAAVALAAAGCGRTGLDAELYGEEPGADAGRDASGDASDARLDGADGADGDAADDARDGDADADADAAGDAEVGAPCVTTGACVDGDFCTDDLCIAGHCQNPRRDDDGDGHVGVRCGGDDCDDTNPLVSPGRPEDCSDGFDDDCNGAIDCQDTTCLGTPGCACAPRETCGNGLDDDCNGRFDCDDPACASDRACRCAAATELCGNGVDDDCNDLVDCADPRCAGASACSCNGRPPAPEACTNGVDDDCDGKVDCQDPDCLVAPACSRCTTELCQNGLDDNCDGRIDCADPSCFFDPACDAQPELCNNGKDDDHDGLIDCHDPDCRTNPLCVSQHASCLTPKLLAASGTYTGDTTGFVGETTGSCGGAAGEADFYFVVRQPTRVHLDTVGTAFDSMLYVRTGACRAGHEIDCDDDSGGNHAASLDIPILYPGTYYVFVDGFTIDATQGPDEGAYALHADFTANPTETCDNGIDDDGDRWVDCADPDCASVGKCALCRGGQPPRPEMGVGACTDGVDDDCDGEVDCADSDCHASDYYSTECCNGLDDNGNGIVDDFSCRCASDAECGGGQLCYGHTASACGDACTGYVGDICPYVASGSACSPQTSQCEFPP